MIKPLLALLLIPGGYEPQPADDGSIAGVILNATRNGEPITDAEVVLRAGIDGRFEPVAATTTDLYGRFSFSALPLEPKVIYLAGVNRDGVHYPGSRVRLDARNRIANVQIIAYDATSTSPLALERHDIDIDVQGRVLSVAETLSVSNPSRTTYVGHSNQEGGSVTLRLSVPATFDRVTFELEHYGRRFRIVDRRLVTDVPWPPGIRKVSFKYRIPLEEVSGVFQRPLDLACAQVNVRIRTNEPHQISCNLARTHDDGDAVAFESRQEELPIGFVVQVQVGDLAAPWTFYTRLASVGVLGVLIVATLLRRRIRGAHSVVQLEAQISSHHGLSADAKSRRRAT